MVKGLPSYLPLPNELSFLLARVIYFGKRLVPQDKMEHTDRSIGGTQKSRANLPAHAHPANKATKGSTLSAAGTLRQRATNPLHGHALMPTKPFLMAWHNGGTGT